MEEAAREIRYRHITVYLQKHPDITCVLTAHHADDQAETVLFRLLRGTSLHGLAGIPSVRLLSVPDTQAQNGTRAVPLIRPLLSFTKKELSDYLACSSIAHVTDSTNADNNASRNLLRNTLIPAAKAINPAFIDALHRLSVFSSEDESYFYALTNAFFQKKSLTPADPIPLSVLQKEHPACRRRILAAVYHACQSADSHLKPLTAAHLHAMLRAAETQSRTELSGGWCFSAQEGICRMEQISDKPTTHDYHLALYPGEITVLPTGGCCLLCDGSVKSSENFEYLKNIYNFFISTHINSDKLIDDVYLRPRCDNQTDRYLCGGSHKTAKDALSAHRVSASLRETVPLFCDGDGIVWIPFCGTRDSVNPRFAAEGAQIVDLYYFYNSEVSNYASRY